MELQDILHEYLRYKEVYTSYRTQEIYARNLQKFFDFCNKQDITHYRMEDIYAFTNYLKHKKHCKGATIANYIASIKSFFKYTKEMGYTKLSHVLIRAPRYEEATPTHVTEEDFYMIDEWLDEQSYAYMRKRLLFRLLWDTGARINEILNLNLEDINTSGQFALIKRQKNMQKNIIMWSDDTQELLIKYLGIRVCLDEPTDALFVSYHCIQGSGSVSTRLHCRSVQRWLKQICKDIGIEKKLTPHSFRHGKAHKIMKKTGRQSDVKAILYR